MAAAWTIGTFFKIPIRLHYSMALLLLTYKWIPGEGVKSLVFWLLLMACLFGSILLHEVGHALTARFFGIQTHDILLTPIGGIARILGTPRNPRQEITIAIAGPIVSFALAALLYLVHNGLEIIGTPFLFYTLVYQLYFINLMLGLFNLIPALPMDGGRILRGLLGLKYDHLTATIKAAKLARILAVLGVIIVLFGSMFKFFEFQWTVIIIAIFVYITSGLEVRMAKTKAYYEKSIKSNGGFSWPNQSATPGVYTRTWTFNTSQHNEPKPSDPPTESKSDWSLQDSNQRDDVIVVTGGRAEVVSRKDPQDDENKE